MKITRKALMRSGSIAIMLSLVLFACQKDVTPVSNSSGPRKVALYLTDDPCQYDSVFIDIKTVELKIDTSSAHREDDHFGDNEDDHTEDHHDHDQNGFWDTIHIRPGVYDILQLRNGIDTILGTTEIPAGKIRKIRLTLGTQNSVVISGVSYPLHQIHDNNYEYVKIHENDEDNSFRSGQTSMWLDFNVCKSIKESDGQYFLKPFLSVFSMHNTGSIEGKILPYASRPFITVWNETDTASALPGEEGEYKIRGLNAGIYSIEFKGSFGYKDTTITGIEVKNQEVVKIPLITLHQ